MEKDASISPPPPICAYSVQQQHNKLTNDKVSAAVILTDHHVLKSLTRTSHVHGVREVSPLDTRVLGLLLEHLIGTVTDNTGNIISLSRTAGGVD